MLNLREWEPQEARIKSFAITRLIKSSDTMTFTCNYTKADFTAVNAEANKPLHYELSFSDGSKFVWQGQHTCGLPGKGVNEVIEFTINIAASTPVVFATT